MAAEKPNPKGQAWFCTAGLPSDVVIQVDNMTFHLHKFPLMSKSRKLHQMITEKEKRPRTGTGTATVQRFDNDTGEKGEIQEEEEDGDGEQCHIVLPDFPGGSESFEAAAKFSYGVKVDLSANNVALLRCAGDYLEMTEEHSQDNLISRTERFISESVLRSIKLSIRTLISCQAVLPAAENLGIVQRCIEAAAAASDPSLFGWPVNDKVAAEEANPRRNLSKGGDTVADELGLLSLSFFRRLIFAMKGLDLRPEIIESCLIHYAKKYIPGISRTSRKPSSSSSTENEQRELLETVISNLPIEKTQGSASNTTTRVLLGLLRTAYILNASDSCRSTLEKKIGSQLEQATLDDLLIPSYSYLNETLYDVDCVERILSFFVRSEAENENSSALMLVGKLIDGYLSEIASDANLKPEKLYNLAIALPDHARLFDDGLYRAVDVYLKAHPRISEAEREKICGVLDCRKLTLEACTHAAQNERLPLRAVIQVLFFEQLQLRHAIAGTLLAADSPEDERLVSNVEEGNTWQATVRENQVLRKDMNTMRTRVQELEKECTSMKKAIQKIDKPGHVEKGGWRAKIGCKFKTQVCDSQAVDDRKRGRRRPVQ